MKLFNNFPTAANTESGLAKEFQSTRWIYPIGQLFNVDKLVKHLTWLPLHTIALQTYGSHIANMGMHYQNVLAMCEPYVNVNIKVKEIENSIYVCNIHYYTGQIWSWKFDIWFAIR